MNTVRPLDTMWQDLRLRRRGCCSATRALPRPRSFRWRWASAPTPRSSSCSTPCGCASLPVDRPARAGRCVVSRAAVAQRPVLEPAGRSLTSAQVDETRSSRVSRVFAGMFAWSSAQLNTADGRRSAATSKRSWASGEVFDVLGVKPAIGRVLRRRTTIGPGAARRPRCSAMRTGSASLAAAPSVLRADRAPRGHAVRHRRRDRAGFLRPRCRPAVRCRDAALRRCAAAERRAAASSRAATGGSPWWAGCAPGQTAAVGQSII